MAERAGEDFEYRDALLQGVVRGRGAGLNPGNRFESVRLHVLGEHLDQIIAEDPDQSGRQIVTHVYRDTTRTIINYVDPKVSPELSFMWTVNCYRGCEHGCIYCFARPYHEFLGFSSGIDFETKIVAKVDAPRLLEEELASPSWQPDNIVMSVATDGWQPVEAKLRLTRGCLEVMARCRQPASLITKNRLILRDLDLIQELAHHNAVHVSVSLTTLDTKLAAKMEPRASSPADRLHTIRELARAGVPVTVMTAPIIPALNDREIPQLLEAAADAGAKSAGYVLLRLPHQIKALFLDWLARNFPERAGHVETLIRGARGGKLYDATHGVRMRGEGPVAEQIGRVFKVFRRRYGLDGSLPEYNREAFRRPSVGGQMRLFE
jgi:DNA repair photolyase